MNKKKFRNIDILIIANLEHASPRIPGLSQYMCEKKDSIRIITPLNSKEFIKKYGIYNLDKNYFKLIDAPYSGDLLNFFRKILWLIGFDKKISLTEQLKKDANSKNNKNFWSKLKLKIPEFLLYRFQEIFAIPDLEITWYRSAINSSNIQINLRRPDFIISSSPFMTSHLVASKLSKKHKITWIADYRDTWSNNPVYPFSYLRMILDKFLEKKIIKNSSLITTVSEEYAKKLTSIHNRKIEIIPNGYTYFNQKKIKKNRSLFRIVYTGTLYENYQNYPLFLESVKLAIDNSMIDKRNFRIEFYGRYLSNLQEQIQKLDLLECVSQNGYIDRELCFKIQQNANLLLFFNWEGRDAGLSHLKLYEYLGSQRPILLVGSKPDNLNQNIIETTKSGYICIGKDQIYKCLTDLYKKYEIGADIVYKPNITEIRKHSYYNRGKILRNLITSM